MNEIPMIVTNHRKGNLHVEITGPFTPLAATRIVASIASEYRGQGNIFVHTNHVTAVHPEASKTLECLIDSHQLPRNNLYLTGRLALAISPDRIKIIAYREKKRTCSGHCRNCRCQEKKVKEQRHGATNPHPRTSLSDFRA